MTARPVGSQPVPHAALTRAGFTLVTVHGGTDPQTAWEQRRDDGTPLYHIQRHGEGKAPHRWSHRVDVWWCNRDGEWHRRAVDIDLHSAIARYGQPANPEDDS